MEVEVGSRGAIEREWIYGILLLYYIHVSLFILKIKELEKNIIFSFFLLFA